MTIIDWLLILNALLSLLIIYLTNQIARRGGTVRYDPWNSKKDYQGITEDGRIRPSKRQSKEKRARKVIKILLYINPIISIGVVLMRKFCHY